jgi:ATP phosphoribosyltransferase regulatory subunit HisZ
MRRTFQDSARAAEVRDVVTRAISGHATETMQQHYSTVAPEEMRQNLAKVISLLGVKEKMAAAVAESSEVVGEVVGERENGKAS